MKLVACSNCHTQFDVSDMASGTAFECRCGVALEANAHAGTDAAIQRCSACGAAVKEGDEVCAYCDSPILQLAHRGSLICPECYARNLDDARFCLSCGVAFDPHAPPSEVAELRCPCCERLMTTRYVGGLTIQECPDCHGLWAPDDSFKSLVERATTAARERASTGESMAPRVDGGNPAAKTVEYRRCPACDALMVRRNFEKRSGVIIDQCHQHGTWLDAHELERIAGFVLSGRAEKAAELEAAARVDEERSRAREAALRSQHVVFESRESEYSIFGTRRQNTAVETIFDLLTSLLR